MKKLFITLVSVCISYWANAQKLPRVQKASVPAPANIKIDGLATEWNDQFQADNPTCRLWYTVANDSQNVYLLVRMQGPRGNLKAIQNGIAFTIKSPNTKNEGLSVTFPSVPKQLDAKRNLVKTTATSYTSLRAGKDVVTSKRIADSLIRTGNKQITDAFKEIELSGIKDITEPLISVYNDTGIRVAAQFDQEMRYTYELAIPLKYLDASIIAAGKLSYNIKLESVAPKFISNPNMPPPPVAARDDNAPVNYDYEYLNNPTDFSGEYTLVK